MKRIAGFLVLTSLATACEGSKSTVSQEENKPSIEPVQAAAAQAENADEPTSAAREDQAIDTTAKNSAEQDTEAHNSPAAGATATTGTGAVPKTAEASAENGQAVIKAQVVNGPAAMGEGYSVQLQTVSPLKVGEPGSLTVALTAKAPFKCNDKYPYKFKFESNSNVSFASEVVRGMKVDGKHATLTAPITAKSSGKQTVAGELSFSVCTDDKCLVEKQRLSISFDVNGS